MRATDDAPHPNAIKRQKYGRYGTALFCVGIAAALVAMWWLESVAFATLWLGAAMVGGGFLAAGDIKGLFGGGS